jgi:hypothetical protein
MSYPNDASGDVFRRLEAHGFDFSVPHNVEFFALFPTESQADKVARQYAAKHAAGDTLTNIETRPAKKGGMELVVVKPMLVTYEGVTKFEAELSARVSPEGGRLDGWGVMQG